ncbi:Clr5 domain-containing protein [Coniochaeta sp. 2T2.1]|nr:Clr5 domain-containing protein [Coniochaeta sp. 2T2.1]
MTKKWDEHRATIISLYKEQHKPLREVQRLMKEQYGFDASVRAYRSRFDRWGVHKYNCRRRGSGSNGSDEGSSPPTTDESYHDATTEERQASSSSPAVTVTPPSSPHNGEDQTTPRQAREQQQRHLTLHPVPMISPQQRFFPSSSSSTTTFGTSHNTSNALVPLSPGGTESISSGSTMSRTSSISQTYPTDPYHGRQSQSQGQRGIEYSTSPTEYGRFDVYRQPHGHYTGYQGQQQYQPQLTGGGGLAPPLGVATHDGGGGSCDMWSSTGLHAPGYGPVEAEVKAPRE